LNEFALVSVTRSREEGCLTLASAQQLIGLVKSHAEGDADRFYDLAMQLSAAEEQKGHTRLAEQLRQWAEAGQKPPAKRTPAITPIATPRGDLAECLAASYPTERLDAVILPDKIKGELAHLLVETRKRHKLEEKGLKPRRRVLLSGPPGTGKTLSASALAGELKFPLFSVMLHGLITKFMGESAQKLKMIFDAVQTTRGIYLFDEIDALAAARGGENDVGEARRILNSFLQLLDEDTGPSIVIATTNLPAILDRAVLRRFDLVLSYVMPDGPAIRQALERRLIGFSRADMEWTQIANVAAGLSTADVVTAAEDAARRAVLNDIDKIATQDVLDALKRRRSLQELGTNDNGTRPSALPPSQTWTVSSVSNKEQGRIEKTE
jgi:SpoVK/Ycf46/Vps4 family AAA+-type ATPase